MCSKNFRKQDGLIKFQKTLPSKKYRILWVNSLLLTKLSPSALQLHCPPTLIPNWRGAPSMAIIGQLRLNLGRRSSQQPNDFTLSIHNTLIPVLSDIINNLPKNCENFQKIYNLYSQLVICYKYCFCTFQHILLHKTISIQISKQPKSYKLNTSLKMQQKNYKKMRSKLRINNSISFVEKLLNILQDPQCHPYIEWIDTENGFNISNVSGFSQNVLPTYFKHQNYSSFVRQLNMYGFTKVRSKEGDNIYEHKNFKRGSKTCIKKITRKIPTQSSPKDNEIVLYRPGTLCEKRKTQGQLQKLRQKQIELQKKCVTLLQRNKQLLQQNQMIVSAIKSQQNKKKKLLQQIISILSHKPSNNLIQIQAQHQPIKSQQHIECSSGANLDQQKLKQPINILDPHEQYLKLDDFINIDYDELSQVFKI